MMAQKYLHELLKEDQEPFLLNKYISDRRNQIKRPSPKPSTSLQLKKRKPIHQNQNFPRNLCKNACLFSLPETPDLRKSPLFEFASPVKSPCNKSPNAIFLHIPSRTASLLLEASHRIQKQKQSSPKTKTKTKGFGLFGSLFKRLTQRNQNHRKREIEGGGGVNVSVKDILKWDSSAAGRRKLSNGKEREKMDSDSQNDNNMVNGNASEVGFGCSYNGRPSSAVWSESNEDKSLDMETSSSGHSDDCEEGIIHFVTNHEDCSCCSHRAFCESPFRFVLQTTTPCSGSHTPELASPSRHITEDKESTGAESVNQLKSGEEEEEEEEEDKEQCSPVSVLDTPFEDDDEGHGNDDEDGDRFDLESSYAIVQRAKQQILYKLRRFEKLAELDPTELERRMMDQEEEEDEDETFMEEDDWEESSSKENDFRELVFEAVCSLSKGHDDKQQIPQEFKKLISDLIVEEERGLDCLEDRDMVTRRICKRLESWEEVESNTIDMMIEEDFSREDCGWKKDVEQVRNMAGELELAIFGFLMEEFSEELVC